MTGYDLAAIVVLVLGVLAALTLFAVVRGKLARLRVGVFVERKSEPRIDDVDRYWPEEHDPADAVTERVERVTPRE